jgi:hypothetical protein
MDPSFRFAVVSVSAVVVPGPPITSNSTFAIVPEPEAAAPLLAMEIRTCPVTPRLLAAFQPDVSDPAVTARGERTAALNCTVRSAATSPSTPDT